jgi:hypothetical protein
MTDFRPMEQFGVQFCVLKSRKQVLTCVSPKHIDIRSQGMLARKRSPKGRLMAPTRSIEFPFFDIGGSIGEPRHPGNMVRDRIYIPLSQRAETILITTKARADRKRA